LGRRVGQAWWLWQGDLSGIVAEACEVACIDEGVIFQGICNSRGEASYCSLFCLWEGLDIAPGLFGLVTGEETGGGTGERW